ncbi:condensation domain-containing protein [Pseudonocardia halophobica]|uniref:condensation domain-containing protein n=1 Tax=Pseudonocardia halophobica TaxID=29401 RepID=UPI003D8E00BF
MSTETVTTDADRRAAPAAEPPALPARHPREPDPADDLVVRLRLRGVLDPEALSAAWRDVLDRHTVLRTLTPGPADPGPRVLEAVALARVRRRPVRPEDVEAAAAEALARPAALGTEGPARATLLRVGPEEHVLVLAVHRSAIDDRSVRPLLTDLATAYSARRAGGAPVFPPTSGFAEWLARRDGDMQPRSRLRADPVGRWITVDRALPGGAAEALAALRASHGAAPLAAVLAATVVVEDGAPLDAEDPRRDGGFEGAVGPFATVARVACRAGGTGTEVLGRVLAALTGHRAAHPGPARTLVRHEPGGEPPALDGLVVDREPAPAGPAGYDRVVTLVEGPDGVAVRLAVDAVSGDAAGAAARVRRLAGTLGHLLREPAAPLT